ncbi:hypothetical protein PAND9192_00783 [Photobacterium andalusiense]|uniref:Uncharacterized protein n=1 Tax=Photobacterium andalusiense TaxID=2204296 RepID=A0A1Y6M9C9_9GAMM|nr:hypothetical protein PAND9192_00783 [Photobacterium andalusiense]
MCSLMIFVERIALEQQKEPETIPVSGLGE